MAAGITLKPIAGRRRPCSRSRPPSRRSCPLSSPFTSARSVSSPAAGHQAVPRRRHRPGRGRDRCDLVHAVDPDCRVVHVDDDPMVLTHLRAFSTSASQGAFAALDAKLTDPGRAAGGGGRDARLPAACGAAAAILAPVHRQHRAGRRDRVGADGAVHRPELPRALPRRRATSTRPSGRASTYWNRISARQFTLRSRAEVAALTVGLDVVEPGLVPVNEWRPAPGEPVSAGRSPSTRCWPGKPVRPTAPVRPRSVRNQRHLNSRAFDFRTDRGDFIPRPRAGHPKETPWASGSSAE